MKPTKEVLERLEKLYHSLDVITEDISNIVYSGNLIKWAEDIAQDENASEEDLGAAEGLLEIADKLCL
jgi:hypothetical protein